MSEHVPDTRWVLKRVKEYEELSQLIITCESLNASNNILGNIQKAIEIAKRLNKTNWHAKDGEDMRSFMTFLADVVVENREANNLISKP